MKSFSEFTGLTRTTPKVISELTVSPDYQQKGVFNPYYTLDTKLDPITNIVGDGEIKFRCTDTPSGEELLTLGNGKFFFQVEKDGNDTPYYVRTTKSKVLQHFGMKKRKNSTASSNVNEFLTVYFLVNPEEKNMDSVEWEKEVGGRSGKTGVLNGEMQDVTFEDLIELLDADETAQRDIKIGMANASAVATDLKGKTIKKVYWVPRAKGNNISALNPSDVIIELDDGFVGYSNKIAGGKDATPKMNSSIVAQYEKLDDNKQVKRIKTFIDKSLKAAFDNVTNLQLKKSITPLVKKVSKEKYTEGGSKATFIKIAKEFNKHGLNFYQDGFYYTFRNTLIDQFSKYLKKDVNLQYMLNTMGFYTYPDADSTPCPYKLLIGAESKSVIKDVGENEELKSIFLDKDNKSYSSIRIEYKEGQQSFKVYFRHKPTGKNCMLPITLRTRSAGGWSGKALYMTSSGLVVK